MQSYKEFLSELHSTGQSRLSQSKTPTELLEFFLERVETLTTIHGGKPRRSDLTDLFRRILRKAKPCYSSVVVAMFYLDRMWRQLSLQQQQNPTKQSQFGHDGLAEVIAAFILADKYLFDIALANCEWVKVSGVFTQQQINSFEREFLALLSYNIQFSEQEFAEFVSFLEVSLTIRHHKLEAVADFPLTYSDLVVLNARRAEEAQLLQQQQQQSREAALATLRMMMVWCVACCAATLTITAAAEKLKVTAEAFTAEQKAMKSYKLTRSGSWAGFSAVQKAKGRKSSDALLGESAAWRHNLLALVRS